MHPKHVRNALVKVLPSQGLPIFEKTQIKQVEIQEHQEAFSHPALQRHFHENILPILALYLVLKEEQNLPDNAIETIRSIINEMYQVSVKRMAFLGRFPFFFWLLRKTTPRLMKKNSPHQAGKLNGWR